MIQFPSIILDDNSIFLYCEEEQNGGVIPMAVADGGHYSIPD
jgi:hypothetical protein